jgi:murein DD-endopeptidase MepM/ murein hydrolase activator NlpD
MTKQAFLLFAILAGSYGSYAQKESMVDKIIECYETYFALAKPDSPKAKQENAPKPKQDSPKPKQDSPSSTKTICPPEPDDFYNFFKTNFIDFASLREKEGVAKTFSFSDDLCSPLKTLKITAPYGEIRKDETGKKTKHLGVDFRLSMGDTVCSVFCGRVRIAKWDDAYGNVVVVRHYNMSETVYAHLDKILVDVNQQVEVGQTIGLGGNTGRSTGPHLHFEIRYKGYPINPIVKDKFLMHIPATTAR